MKYTTYYKEYTIAEGIELLKAPRKKRVADGMKISAPGGVELYLHMNNNSEAIKCWHCGLEATVFVLEHRHRCFGQAPILELYAKVDGRLILMTRDHIIPRAVGGTDAVENLRPGCTKCNGKRGHKMTEDEIEFMKTHPHLVKVNHEKTSDSTADC